MEWNDEAHCVDLDGTGKQGDRCHGSSTVMLVCVRGGRMRLGSVGDVRMMAGASTVQGVSEARL